MLANRIWVQVLQLEQQIATRGYWNQIRDYWFHGVQLQKLNSRPSGQEKTKLAEIYIPISKVLFYSKSFYFALLIQTLGCSNTIRGTMASAFHHYFRVSSRHLPQKSSSTLSLLTSLSWFNRFSCNTLEAQLAAKLPKLCIARLVEIQYQVSR